MSTDFKPLRLALTKGRLEKKTHALLSSAGVDMSELENKGRRLIIPLAGANIEIMLAQAPDVITYVEHGVCELGIVGKDTIMEHATTFYEILDLGFGACRFALAGKKDTDFYSGYGKKVIATKYPNIAKEFFASKGIDIEIIKIEGSVELAPILGLSDAIIDIVETGETLKENGLVIIEEFAPISARLIVNQAAMKMKKNQIDDFVKLIGQRDV